MISRNATFGYGIKDMDFQVDNQLNNDPNAFPLPQSNMLSVALFLML